jgi:hypothetical protein
MATLKDILVAMLLISSVAMYVSGHWIGGTILLIVMFKEARYRSW